MVSLPPDGLQRAFRTRAQSSITSVARPGAAGYRRSGGHWLIKRRSIDRWWSSLASAVTNRKRGCFGTSAEMQLLQQVADVGLDRSLAQAELFTNDAVRLSVSNQRQDVALLRREPGRGEWVVCTAPRRASGRSK